MDNPARFRYAPNRCKQGRNSDGATRRSFSKGPPRPDMPRVYRRTRYGQKAGPVFSPLAKIFRSRRFAPLLTFAACGDPCKGMVGTEEWPLVLIEQRNEEGRNRQATASTAGPCAAERAKRAFEGEPWADSTAPIFHRTRLFAQSRCPCLVMLRIILNQQAPPTI